MPPLASSLFAGISIETGPSPITIVAYRDGVPIWSRFRISERLTGGTDYVGPGAEETVDAIYDALDYALGEAKRAFGPPMVLDALTGMPRRPE